MARVYVDINRCKGCFLCVSVCPKGVFVPSKELGAKGFELVHLDEETPHIHCVVVPLVKKLDKRTNTERYTISKKQYIRDKIHLSELQDKYHARLVSKGFELERGLPAEETKRKHETIQNYKYFSKNDSGL